MIFDDNNVPNFIGEEKKGDYSYEEIVKLANQVKYIADKNIDILSK